MTGDSGDLDSLDSDDMGLNLDGQDSDMEGTDAAKLLANGQTKMNRSGAISDDDFSNF